MVSFNTMIWIYSIFLRVLLHNLLTQHDVTVAAPQRQQKAGPCVGMDCLHGVMMHADIDQGESHQDQHTYERLQREDKIKLTKIKPGPCEGTDCLHELMHTDGEISSHDKMGPEQKKAVGPEEGMDYLHGVMMHGDDKPGLKHAVEDADKQKHESQHEPDGPCLDCAEGRLHSAHLQRDNTDVYDETEHQREPVQFMATDPDKLLHSEGHSDNTAAGSEEQEADPQGVPGIFDPDSFLHPDGSDHKSKPETKDEEPRAKPLVFDPDKMLHAEGETHDEQIMQQEKDDKVRVVYGTYDLESALHGEDAKDIHSDKQTDPETDNTQRQKSGTFNPDILLHGGDEHAHDPKKEIEKVELGKIKDQHEHDDFKRWMAEKIKKGEAKEKEGGGIGFSRPFISDTVLDDIDQMKQRYVLEDWGDSDQGDQDSQEDTDSAENEDEWEWEEYEESDEDSEGEAEEELEEMELEQELTELRDALVEDDPDTPCVDCDEGRQHAHGEQLAFKRINVHDRRSREYAESEEQDMRHELERIGDTRPVRGDVDIMMEHKKKSQQNKDL